MNGIALMGRHMRDSRLVCKESNLGCGFMAVNLAWVQFSGSRRTEGLLGPQTNTNAINPKTSPHPQPYPVLYKKRMDGK